jgi:hypothetical protein
MSLWGNADKSTLTGTVTVAGNSATVTGSGTSFTDEIDVGDLLMVTTDTTANRVKSITSDTVLTLTANYAGADAGASKAVHKRETPRNLSISDSNAIFGVTTAETTGGEGIIVSMSVDSGGTGYASAPTVTVASGAGAGTAVVSATTGKVTSITITNQGASYDPAPALAITAPVAKTFNGASAVDPATDQITVTGHKMETGDEVTLASSNTLPTGLSAGTYYVIFVDANNIKLATGAELAREGTAVDITVDGSGNSTLTGVTATAVATLGSGSPATVQHPGWVKRTVGTGGRAGRIQYETLVAMSSITGEAEGSIDEFPE